MTKLVVDHFVASPDRDDESLYLTWQAICAALKDSTCVSHPVMEGKNLAEEGDDEVAYFRDHLAEAVEVLAVLESSTCSRRQAREAWDEAFGTTYFSDQPSDDQDRSSNKRGPFITTSAAVARRDDGERRFC